MFMDKKSAALPMPTFFELLRDPRALLAFGFGSGLSRIMPGTMGSIVGVGLYFFFAQINLWFYLAIVITSFFIGNYLCGYASKKLNVHDHPGIVWDEFVGMWITLIAVPITWPYVLLGFILFRFFDMLKPWPISIADKHLHGGFGIMFDDVLAGIAAWVCLQLIIYFDVLAMFAGM